MNTRSLENERMRGRDREKGCTKAKEREAEKGRAAKTRKEKKGKTGRQMVTDKKNSRKDIRHVHDHTLDPLNSTRAYTLKLTDTHTYAN